MASLKGKVAIVTGAGSKRGMGHAVAVRLGGQGAKVIVADKELIPRSIWPGDETWGGLNEVMSQVIQEGGEGMATVADVSNAEQVDNLVAETIRQFGTIDILVHCVGIRGPVSTPIVDLDIETWRRMMDVNLTGAFLVSRAVAKAMIPDGQGKKIVLISSLAGSRGQPGSAGYCASKHGVIGLGKTLALELAKYKINVNVISPAIFSTNLRDESLVARAKSEGISVSDLIARQSQNPPSVHLDIPLARIGTVEDVADLVLFLVSDAASYITGEEIRLAGGVGVS